MATAPDPNQAYRRVRRSERFRCLIPVLPPWGSVTVDARALHMPPGRVHHLWSGETGCGGTLDEDGRRRSVSCVWTLACYPTGTKVTGIQGKVELWVVLE